MLAGLSGCVQENEGAGSATDSPSGTGETGTGTHTIGASYPPPDGEPCDLSQHELGVWVSDTRNGSHHHQVEISFNDVTVVITSNLGRGAERTLQAYGPFRVDYLETATAIWEIDETREHAEFSPVCHPKTAYVEFRMRDSGRSIASQYGAT